MQITAAVVRECAGPFNLEDVELCEPRDGEILVEVAASGMCQTDLHARDGFYPSMRYPAIFGHEGAGVVQAVGARVSELKVGDHVVMSFPWCGECPNCRSRRSSYCLDARKLKHNGTRRDGSTLHEKDGKPVYAAFFQQSSFGTHLVGDARYAVKVRHDAPIEMLGPLACGGQTGAGAVLNVMKPRAGEAFVVFGVGGVGLSGLMAAKIAGCDPVIAVDVHEHRLALARKLGATHVINHGGRTDVVAEIRRLTGFGVRFSLETSALPQVLREAIEALMPTGLCVLVGTARAGTEVAIEMPFIQNGREVRGVIQGDSEPKTFIPELVDHLMAGRFPLDRIVTFYDFAEINRAAAESSAGKAIKPVLRMAR
ncbi:MAG TPA: NAD(P)-dependent alcohol dehydrogenase [Pseudolabrys sp.]|nr:NAD(P)-dependent alcohol dehydrogenase [Pseudolabrys sp.]